MAGSNGTTPPPPRRRPWWKRLLTITAAVVVVLIVGVLAFASFSVRRAFPDVDGDLVVPGLIDDVGVVRG